MHPTCQSQSLHLFVIVADVRNLHNTSTETEREGKGERERIEIENQYDFSGFPSHTKIKSREEKKEVYQSSYPFWVQVEGHV